MGNKNDFLLKFQLLSYYKNGPKQIFDIFFNKVK
jgi:hypothetical protein